MAEVAQRLHKQGKVDTCSAAGGVSGRLGTRHAVSQFQETVTRVTAQSAPRNALPEQLRGRMEAISGIALEDVRVHRNSARPAQLQAHAYAQGTDIYLGPGQDHHLPHETWHVVQQKQRRVRPTTRVEGVAVNDDVSLEREADIMVRRAAEVAPTAGPLERAAPGAPVAQGVFTFVSNRFVFSKKRIEDAMDGDKLKQLRSVLSNATRRQAVLDKIEDWANCDEDVGYKGKTYEDLIKNALREVNRETRVDDISEPVTPSSGRVNDRDSVNQELSASSSEKRERLATLRRQASESMMELLEFRDTTKQRYLQHDQDDTQFSVGHTGNFVLGGSLPQDYAELIHHIELTTGLAGARLATVLLDAMDAKITAQSQQGGIAKFVVLAYAAETRRAAINPLAIRAALQKAQRDNSDVFQTLYDNVLCISSGGSMQSQYHRRNVDENPHFSATLPNEYDALVESAARQGYDVRDQDQMKGFIDRMARNHVLAHNVMFLGQQRPEPKMGVVGQTPQSGLTGGKLLIAIAAISFIILSISIMMRGSANS